MPPRNRYAVERGQELRAQVKAILLAHPQGLAPLTAKHIQARLLRDPMPAAQTIRWHVRAIRAEITAELAAAVKQGTE